MTAPGKLALCQAVLTGSRHACRKPPKTGKGRERGPNPEARRGLGEHDGTEDRAALEQALARTDLEAASRAAVQTAIAEAEAAHRWRSELSRLDARTLELPDLGPAPVARAGLELLADRLSELG